MSFPVSTLQRRLIWLEELRFAYWTLELRWNSGFLLNVDLPHPLLLTNYFDLIA